MLAQRGLITDASQLLTVFETGSLDALTEGRDAQLILSKQIVEALRNGEPVPEPVITDDHKLMIRALADLSSDMSIRLEHPEMLEPIFAQLKKHMEFLQNPEIAILMGVLGQEALPPNQPPGGAPGQPIATGGAPLEMNATLNAGQKPSGPALPPGGPKAGQSPSPASPGNMAKPPNNVGNMPSLSPGNTPNAGNSGITQ
jgi:hypothetical protein